MNNGSVTPRVDQTALKFNQLCIITLLAVAMLLDAVWLLAFVGLVMLIGTIWPAAGLFKLIYARLLRPAGLLKPVVVPDDPRPHLFAQGLGGVVLTAALFAWVLGVPLVAWAMAGLVILLAGINLTAGFCLGCFIYYQLARRGIQAQLPQWQAVPVVVRRTTGPESQPRRDN